MSTVRHANDFCVCGQRATVQRTTPNHYRATPISWKKGGNYKCWSCHVHLTLQSLSHLKMIFFFVLSSLTSTLNRWDANTDSLEFESSVHNKWLQDQKPPGGRISFKKHMPICSFSACGTHMLIKQIKQLSATVSPFKAKCTIILKGWISKLIKKFHLLDNHQFLSRHLQPILPSR